MDIFNCQDEQRKFFKICDKLEWDSFDSLGESIGVVPVDDPDEYDTIKDAVVFASPMVDDIHYCLLPADSSSHDFDIYYIFPNMGDFSQFVIAHSMDEFLSLAISIYGSFECIFDCEDSQEFAEKIEDVLDLHAGELESDKVIADLAAIGKSYEITKYTPEQVYNIVMGYQQ